MGSLAPGRVSRWRTALRLGRVSNLPTVWSNVIAGCALAGGAPLHVQATLCAAVSTMYVGGMFLNDAFDREIDARERPDRPIPAGEVSAEGVYVVGGCLLVIGAVALAAINNRAAFAGVMLAGAIVLYNWRHKGVAFAPFVMGLCRALVYVAAATAVAVSMPASVLAAAAATLAYVAGLTFTARMESVDRIGSTWPLALLAAPLILGLAYTDYSPPALIALAALAASGARVAQHLRRRAAGDVARAVGLLIAAIAVNDALFATTVGAAHAAYACLACFALTLVLQRYVPAS
jgi:hypothetical protein